MPRKSREREREQQRKERKRQRVDAPDAGAPAQAAPEDAEDEPAPDPALLQLAAEIADQLGETEEEPRATVLRIVQRLGAESALALLQETQAIEARGGMWLGDGSRRRTPGGVFFQLTRKRSEKPDRLAIFYPEYARIEPLNAEEIGALLADAPQWPRAAVQRIRLRLVGRPARIPPPDLPPETPYVIFNLESGVEQAPLLPKELPPVSAATSYRVLAATEQWLKIAPALLRQPDARISVVGQVAINPKRPGVLTVRAAGLKLLVPRSLGSCGGDSRRIPGPLHTSQGGGLEAALPPSDPHPRSDDND
jgi:hypothetical protein